MPADIWQREKPLTKEASVGRFTESTDVRATPEETFAYITDMARLAEWNNHVQWAEVVGGEKVDVGSKLRQHRRRNNKEFDLYFEVTANDPPSRHVVAGPVLGVDTTMTFTVAPNGPATRVTMTADVEGMECVDCSRQWWAARCASGH
jgi:hypothetical protein